MRKIKKTGAILLIILFLSSIGIIQTTAETTTPSEQLSVHPTDNLQQIIDTAENNSSIQLLPGIYNQSITITKPLTITSQDPNNPAYIINKTKPNKPIITVKSEHVSLQNLILTNTAEGLYTSAIRILSSHTNIQNCTVTSTPIGIAIWTSNNTITHCTFENCTDEGIVCLSTSLSSSNHNTISHCTFTNNCDAIELQQSSYNIITNCDMTQNTHCAIDAIKTQNNYNTIAHCTITDTPVIGLYFSNSSDNLITNCSFENNTKDTLFTKGSYNNRILTSTQELLAPIISIIETLFEQSFLLDFIQRIHTILKTNLNTYF